jgi:hypothetical protein
MLMKWTFIALLLLLSISLIGNAITVYNNGNYILLLGKYSVIQAGKEGGLYYVFQLGNAYYHNGNYYPNVTIFYGNNTILSTVGFLGLNETPLGLLTVSDFYVYLNTTPIISTPYEVLAYTYYQDKIAVLLDTYSNMGFYEIVIWTPSNYTIFSLNTSSLFSPGDLKIIHVKFFLSFNSNGDLEYLILLYTTPVGQPSRFLAIYNSTNINKSIFFTAYNPYVSAQDGKFIILSNNVSSGEAFLWINGELTIFNGSLESYFPLQNPKFFIVNEGNGNSVLYSISGEKISVIRGTSVYVFELNSSCYYIYSNFTNSQILYKFSPPESLSLSYVENTQPVVINFSNNTLDIKLLTSNGYVNYYTVLINTSNELELSNIIFNGNYTVIYLKNEGVSPNDLVNVYDTLILYKPGFYDVYIPSPYPIYPNCVHDVVNFIFPNNLTIKLLSQTLSSKSSNHFLSVLAPSVIALVIISVIVLVVIWRKRE